MQVEAVLTEANQSVPYDRAWACYYDPVAGNVEVLGVVGDVKADQRDAKKDLKPGQRLTLDRSAAGWAVRHRKPRVDHDVASTQGRFLDHKQLFKDRFQSSLVIPFFVKGQVGGTLTLGAKDPERYQTTDASTLEPAIVKLADLLQAPAPQAPAPAPLTELGSPNPQAVSAIPSEPSIRKQDAESIGDMALPDGFQEWEAIKQQAWVAAWVSEQKLNSRIGKEGLQRLASLEVQADLERNGVRVNQAQAEAVNRVQKEMPNLSAVEALALATVRDAEVFTNGANGAPPPSHMVSTPKSGSRTTATKATVSVLNKALVEIKSKQGREALVRDFIAKNILHRN